MYNELFHTPVGLASGVALLSTIMVGVVVSILMVTKVLKDKK
jgi:hypothetical protein